MFTEAQKLQEAEILRKIAEAERELKDTRTRVAQLKKSLLDTETILIRNSLVYDRLQEELRLWRHKNVDDQKHTEREDDIERFRKRLPELDPEAWELVRKDKP